MKTLSIVVLVALVVVGCAKSQEQLDFNDTLGESVQPGDMVVVDNEDKHTAFVIIITANHSPTVLNGFTPINPSAHGELSYASLHGFAKRGWRISVIPKKDVNTALRDAFRSLNYYNEARL